MELNWDSLPEMVIKKNERAAYSGILIPDLNYQNYKELEAENPQIVKMIQAECVESDRTAWYESPYLWTAVGFIVGITVTR